jgi:transposase
MQKGAVRTAAFQAVIKAAELDPADTMRRDHLFRLVAQLNVQIDELSGWLKQKAVEAGKPVELLQTQKGVGYLTALVTFHTLGDVGRFNGRISRQVVNFAGLDPCDDSSGTQIRFGPITKAGPWLLRYQLGQAAVTAIRYDPRLKAFYKRLLKKKQKNVAKTAASRKLLVKLAIMLRDDITAQEFDRRGSTVGNARDGNSLK